MKEKRRAEFFQVTVVVKAKRTLEVYAPDIETAQRNAEQIVTVILQRNGFTNSSVAISEVKGEERK